MTTHPPTTKEALEPCPFSSLSGKHVLETKQDANRWMPFQWVVICWCGATGPQRSSEVDAINAWNSRVPAPIVAPEVDEKDDAFIFRHGADCAWERTTSEECEYKDTHNYCPHPEHACTCPQISGDISDNPTLEEAEAYLRANGVTLEDAANAFIERLLQNNLRLKQEVAALRDEAEMFQNRVQPWMMACFGAEISSDKEERNHRFLEEAIELVQACGASRSEAHQLVDYTFDRPVGNAQQEVGGVMVTLAALCLAQGFDMHECGEVELTRIWGKVDVIRAKQAAKPKHSPLPEHVATTPPSTLAHKAAEEIISAFPEIKEHDKWVTLGRVKIDIATETETFERATAPQLPVKDQIATIIERCLAGGGESTQKVEGGNK